MFMTFRRITIVFTLLAFTNILGLTDSDTTRFIIPLKDYALILIFIYLINHLKLAQIRALSLLQPLFVIVLLSVLVIISMPFRGDISIISSFKYGRIFFILMLSFLIFEEVYFSRSEAFILRIISVTSIYYSVIILANVVFPEFISRIFIGGETMIGENAWSTGGSRFVLKGNAGILFVHLGFLIKTFEYLKTRDRKLLLTLSLLFLAMLLQGWRTPLITVLLCTLAFILRRRFLTRTVYLIPVVVIVILMTLTLERITDHSLVLNKFFSTYNEISGDYSGTLEGRRERSLQYQIPMFLKKKWIGYGFVHENSGLARQLGHQGDGTYSLYYFDFGYHSLLNMFGIAGFVIFMLQFLKILARSFRVATNYEDNPGFSALFVFILALVLGNYSFGALISAIGLLPVAFISGLAQGQYLIRIRG